MKKQYSWSEIHQKIKKYCDSCITCHKIKFVKYKSHGLMKFLLQFQDFWTDVIMDFIIDLSSSDKSKTVFNFILIVMNKYIKMIEYVSAKKNWIAEKLINVFHTRIFVKHDMPNLIIINKKNLFISNFWNVFCYHLIMKLKYSTAFHPQTDGQTERQNSILKQYLRNLVNYQQNDWLKWLSLAEFAYNNSDHVSTKISPFMTYTKKNLKFTEKIRFAEDNHEVPVVKKKIKTIFDIKKNFEAKWQAIKNQQFKWYNLKHKKLVFSLKNKIWLNIKNIQSKWSSKKLNYKYHDSFEIIKLTDKKFYKLKLFDFMNSIHDVFHVFLLKSYKENNDFNSEPFSIEIEENTEWKIKKILNNHIYHD